MASNTTTGSPKMVAIQEPHLEKSFVKVAKYWEKVESESEAEKEGALSSVELRSGYSSSGNKTTPNKKAAKRRRWSFRDSLTGRGRRKPGSRRYRRWFNDVQLGRRPDELFDTGAIDEDFSYFFEEFLQRSPMSRLLRDDELFEEWKRFIDITEEQQKVLLSDLFSDSESDDENDFFEPINLSSRERYHRIDRDTKKLLKKFNGSTFLLELDDLLLAFLKEKQQSTTSCSQSSFFEYKSLFIANESQLNLSMKDSFHRLIAHGICKFYDLVSQSLENEMGGKTVIVTKKPFTPIPQQSLAEYLQDEFLTEDFNVFVEKKEKRKLKKKGKSNKKNNNNNNNNNNNTYHLARHEKQTTAA